MSLQVNFFAAESDDRALCDRARELGLWLIPSVWRPGTAWPSALTASAHSSCQLSVVEPDRLHPTEVLPKGSGRVSVSWATDPVLEFVGSVVKGRDVVAGRIWWSDYPPEFARLTKPAFDALRKWIRNKWNRRDDGFYAGPDAERLIEEGYEALYLPRGTVIETIKI